MFILYNKITIYVNKSNFFVISKKKVYKIGSKCRYYNNKFLFIIENENVKYMTK